MAYRDTVIASSPTWYVPCDEASGTTHAALVGSIPLIRTGGSTGVPAITDGTGISFPGTSGNYAQMQSALNLSAFNVIGIGCLMKWPTFSSTDGVAWEFGTGVGTTGFGFWPNSASVAGKMFCFHQGNVGFNTSDAPRWDSTLWHHIYIVHDKSQATNEVFVYVDGVLQTVTHLLSANNTNTFGNLVLNVGSRNAASNFAAMSMQHIRIHAGASVLSAGQIAADATASLATDQGVPSWSTLSFSNSDLQDNLSAYTASTVPPSSPLSRLRLSYTGKFLKVTSTNDIYSLYPSSAKLDVITDSTLTETITSVALGTKTKIVDLGTLATTKVIDLLNSDQISVSGLTASKGTYLQTVQYDARYAASVVAPTSNFSTLIYGDSIPGGAQASSPAASYTSLLRTSGGRHSLLEAYGTRALQDDCDTLGHRTTFAAKLVASGARAIVLNIGVNDYASNRQTPTSFLAEFGSLLDLIHAAGDSVLIFCITPYIRSIETANAGGFTLGNYRSSIVTACSTRSWATLIPGETILTLGDLADGTHPTAAGHVKIYNALLPYLLTMDPPFGPINVQSHLMVVGGSLVYMGPA